MVGYLNLVLIIVKSTVASVGAQTNKCVCARACVCVYACVCARARVCVCVLCMVAATFNVIESVILVGGLAVFW